MNSIQISILAIVQGITELLPISSTGHMLLVSEVFFKQEASILLLTVLQFGTTLAIVIAFREFLFKDMFNKEKIFLYFKIAIGSIPAIALSLLFENQIETVLYKPSVIAIMLVVWGIFMILVENFKKEETKTVDLKKVSYLQAIIVGFAQALAIIPGTSRSGSTTVIGILTGIEKYTAIQFSFLLGLPVLVGSFFYELIKYRDSLNIVFTPINIWGMILSFIVGFVSISLLSKFSKSRFLTYFGIYRIILGVLIVIFLI